MGYIIWIILNGTYDMDHNYTLDHSYMVMIWSICYGFSIYLIVNTLIQDNLSIEIFLKRVQT